MQHRGVGLAGDRVGSYTVIQELVRGPGVWLAEARDSDGVQAMLQLARCRAISGPGEEVSRKEFLRSIAAATKQLRSDPDISILESGVISAYDGSLLLYWALPWVEDAIRLGGASALVESVEHLLGVGVSLLELVEKRHRRGCLEPLLSESVIIVRPGNCDAERVGIPIHLQREWLASDMIPPRLAPEEALRLELTQAGDLWRFGRALEEMSKGLTPLPDDMERVLGVLVHPDPALRMPAASEGIRVLRAILSTFAIRIEGAVELDSSVHTLRPRSIVSDMPEFLVEAPVTASPPAPVPRQPIGRGGTVVDEVPRGITSSRPLPQRRETRVPQRRERTNTQSVLRSRPPEHMQPNLHDDEALGRDGGAFRRDREAPARDEGGARDGEAPARDSDAASDDLVTLLLKGEHRVRLLKALGVVLILLALGVAYSLLPSPGSEPETVRVITPRGEVLLNATPSQSIVVSEADGRVLGRVPLRFLVPRGVSVSVLVTSPGHEPQRLVLPERGQVSTELVPLASVEPCEVTLRTPRSSALEAIAAEIRAIGGRYEIPGAALVRSVEGPGAWIVRCPAMGGSDPQILPPTIVLEYVELRVIEPRQASVYVDGAPVGSAPINKMLPAAMVNVRVDPAEGGTVDRWVPVYWNTRLEMPRSISGPGALH